MQSTLKIGLEFKNSSHLKALFHAGFHAFALGIAVISLDLVAVLSWPYTTLFAVEKVLTI